MRILFVSIKHFFADIFRLVVLSFASLSVHSIVSAYLPILFLYA